MGPKLQLTCSFLFNDYIDDYNEHSLLHDWPWELVQGPFLIFNFGKTFNHFSLSRHQFRGNNVEALKSCIQFVSFKNYSENSDNGISCLKHDFTDHLMWARFQVWI